MGRNTENKEKQHTALLGVCLVVVLGAGITLALLSQMSNDVVNNFTVLGGLEVELDENWDPEDGKNIVPGDTALKEPYMVNQSDAATAYVAMQMYLVKGNHSGGAVIAAADLLSAADYRRLLKLVEIRFDTQENAPDFNPKWEAISGDPEMGNGAIFMYDEVLAAGGITEYLFTEVTLSEQASSADLAWIKETLAGFDIYLRGAAVQADKGVTPAEAKTELLDLFTANPVI